jgi:glycosyltransferase involved in cell wall biosynthesis
MRKNIKKKVLIFTYYTFPCSHPVLENVFANEIGKIAEVIWIFHSNISNQNKWKNSSLVLYKILFEKNLINSISNKFIKWVSLIKALKLVFKMKPDVLMIRDLPFYILFFAPFKKILKYKIYYQFSAPQGDISLNHSKNVSGLKKVQLFIKGKIFNIFLSKALHSSDIIFPISEFHKQQLMPLFHHKMMVPITMGVEKKWINANTNSIEQINNIKRKFRILTYFGSISNLRRPEFIIKIFSKVKQHYPEIKLLLIGSIPEKNEMKRIIKTCKMNDVLDDVIFTGRIERRKVKDYLFYTDISISAIPPFETYLISSPTKLYESLGCGVPVVANSEIYEQKKVITESNGGISVTYNVDQFSNAIVYLLENDTVRKDMAKNGKNYIENNYTYEGIANRLFKYFM